MRVLKENLESGRTRAERVSCTKEGIHYGQKYTSVFYDPIGSIIYIVFEIKSQSYYT